MGHPELACDDVGAGPAVVLIHGHPFNRSMWAPQLAALRPAYRVIAPDMGLSMGGLVVMELAAFSGPAIRDLRRLLADLRPVTRDETRSGTAACRR
jgi:3-oxoadipate enol-lactonase